ncbi:MAG: 50S ribosomal protein L25 [Chitinophagales bacterium]
METVVINGAPRTDLGKKATRALRRAGNVPCNLYGGASTINFQAPAAEFRKLIYTPELRIAEINVEGKTYRAIVKELQFEPVKDALLHIDFQELQENVPVKVNVALNLVGTPKGITAGGKLEQAVRRLRIKALPKDLVAHIDLNIADMELGAVKRVRDLAGNGLTFLHSEALPLVRVTIPRTVVEEAPAAAAAPAAAPAAAAKPEEKKK